MSSRRGRDAREEAAEGTRFEPDDFAVEQRRDRTEVRPTDSARERVAREQIDELQDDLPREDDIFLTDDASSVVAGAEVAQETIRGEEELQQATEGRVDLTSPVDVIESLPTDEDVELQIRDDVTRTIRADDVEEAQEAIQERRQELEDDPEGFLEELDTDAIESGQQLDRTARQARARRRETRQAEQDFREEVASDFDRLDPEDIDVDADPQAGRVELTDEAQEELAEEQAREQLAEQVDRDPAEIDIQRDGDVFVVDDDVRVEGDPDTARTQAEQVLGDVEVDAGRSTAASDAQRQADQVLGGVERDVSFESAEPAAEQIGALDRLDRVEAQTDDFREDAADQFGVEPEEVDIEVSDGMLRAVGPQEPVEAGDRTLIARGDDFPSSFDELLDVRPSEGDALLETDLPTTQTEASRDVRRVSAAAVDDIGDTAPVRTISAGIDGVLEQLDENTEATLAAAGAAVVTPEPATSIGGAAVLAAGATVAGAAALSDRAEIDVPERADERERAEITTPADPVERRTELDVGDGDVEATEVEVPATGDPTTSELDPGDPTDTVAEIGVPDVEAAAVVDRPADDGFLTPDGPSIDDAEIIEDSPDRGSPAVVDREPVRFPAEEAFEPAVEETVEESVEFEAEEFDAVTERSVRADPREVVVSDPGSLFEDRSPSSDGVEPGFEVTPGAGVGFTPTPATAFESPTATAFDAPTAAATTVEATPQDVAFPAEFLTEFAPPSPAGGTGQGGGGPPIPRFPRPDEEAEELDPSTDPAFEFDEEQFEVELEDPDFLGDP